MSENSRLAQAILSQLAYIALSTATTDGVPWNAPVYAAFDATYTFFWVSAKYARHSQNIRANHRIAIVVYDSTVPPGTGKGVYMEARADELTASLECRHAFACLRRRGWEHPPSVDMVVGATLRGVYKAVPENIWISTEDSNGLDGRVEVDVTQARETKETLFLSQETNGFATLQETLRNHRFLQQGSNPKRDRDCGWGACGEKRENGMSMGATIGPFMMSIFLLVF